MVKTNSELMYVYIDEYKGIRKQQFNLTSKYNIEYKDLGALYITENRQYIEGFFGENISDLIAVIGENGSGKTRLLEFIKDKLFHNVEKSKYGFMEPENFSTNISSNENHIIIFESNEKINVYYNKNLIGHELSIKGIPKNKYNCYDYSESAFADISDINKIRMVHYCGIYDYSKINLEEKKNRGTCYKFKKNYRDLTTNYLLDISDTYRADEIERQIYYFKGGYNFEFEYPKRLKITLWGDIDKIIKEIDNQIEMTENIYRKKEDYKYKTDNGYEYVKKILLELFDAEEGEKTIGSYMDYKVKFIGILIFNFFLSHAKRGVIFDICNDNILFDVDYKKYGLEKCVVNVLNRFKSICEKSIQDDVNKKIDALIEIVEFISNSKIVPHETRSDYVEEEFYRIDNLERAIEFIEIYKKLQCDILTFDWDDIELSSGQKAFLSIFSRLYTIKKEINYSDYKELLIILDEPEVCFHPKWQKKLINDLLKFCECQYRGKSVQLVITSNSPFIISDLPKNNIIFLKNEDGICKVAEKAGFERTFGANIHTLLATSFFMDDGTIGEFARVKIGEIIKYLKEEEINSVLNKKEYIQLVIDNIGEPIIKNKLQDMYNKKIGQINNDSRIKELTSEIDKLKKIIEKNDYKK
ncbi:AAA family ATPase [Clostridium tagluense]|uniref:AAA family ATPase n=1 Tax=Clostridium tagluense TaxID=360422 RepID=UPI001CF3620B|nr:AAA family ATPase [Clostridium tagluense]MCB2313469.1 AAA family ATPase [Clostridium tagluense]MCB2318264.1 AAA family ATPase [Clostridium tagluense]MCB2323066.1 AAA family ATPase [Clostridium tagluense]MCB2328048.1 AAA family ATPase [Clostridium tagluense]MCB2332796.1 AAA family ATPase [Clostridium tagluense]